MAPAKSLLSHWASDSLITSGVEMFRSVFYVVCVYMLYMDQSVSVKNFGRLNLKACQHPNDCHALCMSSIVVREEREDNKIISDILLYLIW